MNPRQFLPLCALAVLVPATARSADYTIKTGSTNVSVYFVMDTNNNPDFVNYIREGEAVGSLTAGSELAQMDSAHSDNQWKIFNPGAGPDLVRYDLPDAVIAQGASSVVLRLITAEQADHGTIRIDLVGYDPTASALPANVTQFGGSNGTFSGGRPEVNVSHVSGDQGAADNAESFFDGSGYGVHLLRAAVSSVDSQTRLELNAGRGATADAYNGCTAVIIDASASPAVLCMRTIIDTEDSASQPLIVLDSAPPFTVVADDIVEILPQSFAPADRVDLDTTVAAVDTEVGAIKTKTDFLPSATAGAAGGLFIAGTNAATTFGSLTVTGTTTLTGNVAMQDGLTVTRSTANQHGLSITGNGTGYGVLLTAGATGIGLGIGADANDAVNIGTLSGFGIKVGTDSGTAIQAQSAGGNGHGFIALGNGSGEGFKAQGGASGNAMELDGGATGDDFVLTGNDAPSLVSVLTNQLAPADGSITSAKFALDAISANAIAAGAIDRATFAADTGLQSIRSGAAQAGGTNSIRLDASASSTTDFYKHSLIYLTGGTGAGQIRLCTAYNVTTKDATVTPAWISGQEPVNGTTFAILPAGIANVEAWLGTAAATPTQPGVPEVDITHVLGDAVCD